MAEKVVLAFGSVAVWTAMAPGVALIWRPWTEEMQFTFTFKCAAVAVAGKWKADEVALAFGGVAPVTVMAPEAAAALTGHLWTEQTLRAAVAALARDIAIAPNAPGAALWRQPQMAVTPPLSKGANARQMYLAACFSCSSLQMCQHAL